MTLATQHAPGATPHPVADSRPTTSADCERTLLIRALIAVVGGISSARELAEKLAVPRIDAARMIEMVFEHLEQSDFGVEGRGAALARLDIQGNRLLLPLILGPVSGRQRATALSAFDKASEEWSRVLQQSPRVSVVAKRVEASVMTAARTAAAPATEEAVERALEAMCVRGEVLWPMTGPSAEGFEVRHVRYVLDGRR